MRAEGILVLIAAAALLAGCESQDAIQERTLTHSCDPKCYFWAQTDEDRGPIGKDGMRVYIEPSFGDFSYRFEIVPQPMGCVAVWPKEDFERQKNYCGYYRVRMRKVASQQSVKNRPAISEDYSFTLPEEAGRELFGVADKLSNSWRPGGTFWTDGTSVSLEIMKHRRARSMMSNAPLDSDHTNPAAWVAAELHRFALAYGPAGQVPRNPDWHSYVGEDDRFSCNNPGLNIPDPDGFGTGDDACARSLLVKPPR